jgi:hypothetical protein
VRNRGAERSPCRALLVDVDPLLIAGGVREHADLRLRHLMPFAVTQVLALGGGELVEAAESAHI